MPVFEFVCDSCHGEFERLFFGQPKAVTCSRCGSPQVRRKPSTFGTGGTEKKVSGRSSCAGCSSSSCSGCSSH